MTQWLFEGGKKRKTNKIKSPLCICCTSVISHRIKFIELNPFNHTTWTRGGASLLEYILTFGKLPKW